MGAEANDCSRESRSRFRRRPARASRHAGHSCLPCWQLPSDWRNDAILLLSQSPVYRFIPWIDCAPWYQCSRPVNPAVCACPDAPGTSLLRLRTPGGAVPGVHDDRAVPATGSSSGFPETRRNRIPSLPACATTSSPTSKSSSEWSPASAGDFVSTSQPPRSVPRAAPTCCRTCPEPAKT